MGEPCQRAAKVQWSGHKERAPSALVRRVYALHVGPIEQGYHVHHACGNPWCVEPSHLEALPPKIHRERHKYHGLTLGFNETAF